MKIFELDSLTEAQLSALAALMKEFSPDLIPDPAKLLAAVECPATRMFAVVDEGDCENACNNAGGDSRESNGGNCGVDANGNIGGDSRWADRGSDCRDCGVATGVDSGADASGYTGGNSGSSVGGNCGEGRIVGCASLCVFDSPTGRKGHIEDVVVSSNCRGRHLGRKLLEYILDYARTDLAPIDIHLTSRPSRVAANTLYRTLGFEQRDTNVYRLIIK